MVVCGGLFLLTISLQSLSLEHYARNKGTALAAQLVPSTAAPIAVEATPSVIDNLPLKDNLDLYQNDDPGSMVTMYVTVRKGNSADFTNFTWAQVDSFTKYYYTNHQIVKVGEDEAILQIGDENGPLPGELGYRAVVPNSTINIRGATTSLSPQKSFKIELFHGAGEWRGQATINLNKQVYDDTRVKNKLNFDLLKQIPNITSLRTQFVHLYIKDQTTSPWGKAFVDYGLFTQVEQPNQRFLRNHLLDPDAQLYKANEFEFNTDPTKLRLTTDPLYNVNDFFPILEIKGNTDNSKLLQMLSDVNNYDIPIEKTFTKYFNAENYFTWLAFNILVGNADTQTQNFYLYSPHNSDTWYFLPWDYDGTLIIQNRNDLGEFHYGPWENGVSNYWGSVLHNRVLRVDQYRQSLDAKINELMAFLTPERLKSMIDVYRPLTDFYIARMPDLRYLDSNLKIRDQVLQLLPGAVQLNYNLYLESVKKPQPFYLNTPDINNKLLNFSWDEAYDFNGENVSYHFVISSDSDFKNIVYEKTGLNLASIQVDALKPGTYYWGVTATNDSGYTQSPFDYYVDDKGTNHYGVKYLEITSDGQVLEK